MENQTSSLTGEDWFNQKGWSLFDFQKKSWDAVRGEKNGLVNAPTGSGKTYSLLIPMICHPQLIANKNSVGIIWLTPIRALAKEIKQAAERAISEMNLPLTVEIRTGDTSAHRKRQILNQPPNILITTPESLHLFFTYKHYRAFFGHLKYLVVDEWHELLGSKRGVQVELALSRLETISPGLRRWGISATVGNMNEALNVLMGANKGVIITSEIKKAINITSIFPDHIDSLPWAGHLGLHLIEKIIPIIKKSKSTLIFTNTRGQCEIWYQQLLKVCPELAGLIAMHHSSISGELREWVESALQDARLKAVVCTSSLDLGVDFQPVETIIQIGSPKGIARFMQRAGRSGHQPGAVSHIYFVPTHTLELIEASALREAILGGIIEKRIPYQRTFDVLVQYLITLSCGEGFRWSEIAPEIEKTHAFKQISGDDWNQVIEFITTGGAALDAYDEYRKVILDGEIFEIFSKGTANAHRMSIGTIVGENSIQIVLKNGKSLGTIEEYFISRLRIGDVFWFSGRSLELLEFTGTTAKVRPANRKSGKIPSWQGGRMPLSSELASVIRTKLDDYKKQDQVDRELTFLDPLFQLQQFQSHFPSKDEFLIEYIRSPEGFHVMMYPFEGRFVHEGLAALVANKIAEIKPITISMAMNDYGFELLSDQEIPIYEALESDLFAFDDLSRSIEESVNATEMAKRRFRDIAAIAGLVSKGRPGSRIKERHLQSSTRLLFEVYSDYQPDHILLKQAYEEVLYLQLEESRMKEAIRRIQQQKIIFRTPENPTPFSFPIMVDGMRERLSTERLEDRIAKMQLIIE